jgi:hypothetical protein
MSSSCSSSGIDAAIASARAKSVAASPNGLAAASRRRNRGAPSNQGAAAATNASTGSASSRATSGPAIQLPRYVVIEKGARSNGT